MSVCSVLVWCLGFLDSAHGILSVRVHHSGCGVWHAELSGECAPPLSLSCSTSIDIGRQHACRAHLDRPSLLLSATPHRCSLSVARCSTASYTIIRSPAADVT